MLQDKFRPKRTKNYFLIYSQGTEVILPWLTSALLFYFHNFLLEQGKKGYPESYYIPSFVYKSLRLNVFYCNMQGAVGLYFPARLRICQNFCIVANLSISIQLFQKPIVRTCPHHVKTPLIDAVLTHLRSSLCAP